MPASYNTQVTPREPVTLELSEPAPLLLDGMRLLANSAFSLQAAFFLIYIAL
jgi:hypothetical protein